MSKLLGDSGASVLGLGLVLAAFILHRGGMKSQVRIVSFLVIGVGLAVWLDKGVPQAQAASYVAGVILGSVIGWWTHLGDEGQAYRRWMWPIDYVVSAGFILFCSWGIDAAAAEVKDQARTGQYGVPALPRIQGLLVRTMVVFIMYQLLVTATFHVLNVAAGRDYQVGRNLHCFLLMVALLLSEGPAIHYHEDWIGPAFRIVLLTVVWLKAADRPSSVWRFARTLATHEEVIPVTETAEGH